MGRNGKPFMELHDASQENTVFPRSSDPFYLVRYYIKWVTTSWTYGSDRFNMVTSYIKWVTTSWTYSIKQNVKVSAYSFVGT